MNSAKTSDDNTSLRSNDSGIESSTESLKYEKYSLADAINNQSSEEGIKKYVESFLAELSDEIELEKWLDQAAKDFIRHNGDYGFIEFGGEKLDILIEENNNKKFILKGKTYNDLSKESFTDKNLIVQIISESLDIDEAFAKYISASFNQSGSEYAALAVLRNNMQSHSLYLDEKRHFWSFAKIDSNKVRFKTEFTLDNARDPESALSAGKAGVKCNFSFDFAWDQENQKGKAEDITLKLIPVGTFKDALIDKKLSLAKKMYGSIDEMYDATEEILKSNDQFKNKLIDFQQCKKERDFYSNSLKRYKKACFSSAVCVAVSAIGLALCLTGNSGEVNSKISNILDITFIILFTELLVGTAMLITFAVAISNCKEKYKHATERRDQIVVDCMIDGGLLPFDKVFNAFKDHASASLNNAAATDQKKCNTQIYNTVLQSFSRLAGRSVV